MGLREGGSVRAGQGGQVMGGDSVHERSPRRMTHLVVIFLDSRT